VLEEIQALLEARGASAPISITDGEQLLPMTFEDGRWRASGRYYDLADAPFAISAVVRAVLDLRWPLALASDDAELEIIAGASEQYDLRGEGQPALRFFAHDRATDVLYALDLRDPANDPGALTVWEVEHDGSSASPVCTLAELLTR
jgi:hypothetical protein